MDTALTAAEWQALSDCPLLEGASPELVLRVASDAQTRVCRYSSGEVVYSPGRFLRCLGVLLRGTVEVTQGETSVSVLQPGELFGAAALYNDLPRFATTLTARGDCRALLIPQSQLDGLLGREELLRHNYLRYLSGRIRFLSARLQSLSAGGGEERLVRYLLTNHQDGAVHCSATGLAKRLGISRSSLYRAFEDLEARGLIRREGKTVLVHDLQALSLTIRKE